MNDKFKIIFFFNGIDPSSTTIEQHCLNNNLTYPQALSYARDNLVIEPNQIIAFNSTQNSKYKKVYKITDKGDKKPSANEDEKKKRYVLHWKRKNNKQNF